LKWFELIWIQQLQQDPLPSIQFNPNKFIPSILNQSIRLNKFSSIRLNAIHVDSNELDSIQSKPTQIKNIGSGQLRSNPRQFATPAQQERGCPLLPSNIRRTPSSTIGYVQGQAQPHKDTTPNTYIHSVACIAKDPIQRLSAKDCAKDGAEDCVRTCSIFQTQTTYDSCLHIKGRLRRCSASCPRSPPALLLYRSPHPFDDVHIKTTYSKDLPMWWVYSKDDHIQKTCPKTYML